MALSVFEDPDARPDERALAEALGDAWPVWQRVIAETAESYPPLEEQWNHSGPKNGWSMRLRRGDRIIAYLIPQSDRFLVGVVLGERAWQTARASELPAGVREALEAAPRYGEGRGFRFAVATAEEADAVRALTAAKMAR